jgi:predicted RNA-binding Zn-ribbon protein involved in translation (DUF1610 family)
MARSLAQILALRQQVEDELEGLKETDWTPSNLLELPGGWSFRDSQPEVDTRKRADRSEAQKKARQEAQAVRRCACGASLANKKTAKAFRCDACVLEYRRAASRAQKVRGKAARSAEVAERKVERARKKAEAARENAERARLRAEAAREKAKKGGG